MHIGFLVPAFVEKGGLERIAVDLMLGLTERGHHCTLFYPAAGDIPLAYTIPAVLGQVPLPQHPINDAWLERARASLGAAALDVLCYMSNGSPFGRLVPYLCQDLPSSLVWSEHCGPTVQEKFWNPPERLACTAIADALHVLCPSYIDFLPTAQRERAVAIPNFSLIPGTARKLSRSPGTRKRLLVVARLSSTQKQISLLLKAFASIKGAFPDWECRICGEGPQRREYESLIKTLDMESRVQLPGALEHIADEYAAADLFCLPSLFEGLPLALVEAQGFGLPGVGFADCCGVNEVIVHGENGLLAPHRSPESLAHALATLMEDEELRLHMGRRARELYRRYDREHVLDQWESLLQSLAARPVFRTTQAFGDLEDPSHKATLRSLQDNPLRAQDREGWKRAFTVARSMIKRDSLLKKMSESWPRKFLS